MMIEAIQRGLCSVKAEISVCASSTHGTTCEQGSGCATAVVPVSPGAENSGGIYP